MLMVGPRRPVTWLLGAPHGVQVWTMQADVRFFGSVLIGDGPPVILINDRLVDTPGEGDTIMWAFGQIAEGKRGFHARWRS